MTWLSDATLRHLRRVSDWPDLGGGRYRIVTELGQGGMGTVYRARDTELDRDVAIKVLRDPLPDEDAVDRMFREARILARLEHPGVVPVHDVLRLPDGRLAYVMKRIRGDSLDRHCAPDDPLADRLRIFERICEPVSFAHAHAVIHRDLKPQNVMVGPFGEVLVLDWGIAKELHAVQDQAHGSAPGLEDRDPANEETVTRHTAHGTVIGTPAYMAPEQARGDIEQVDERSDVYALGALLQFLLIGSREAGGVDLAELARRRIPKPLRSICRRAMEEAPDARYRTVEELRRDVTRFLSGRAVSAHRETWTEKLVRIGGRYRFAVFLVLAYLVVRLFLIVISSPRG